MDSEPDVTGDTIREKRLGLILVLCGTTLVYVFAHASALLNPYVLNDDVRQQLFWMARWHDPTLFQDDYLARYAQYYVPWGVQAVYYLGSWFMDPIQFSKVVTGVLMVTTAGFLFGLALQFGNVRAAVFVVCLSLFFTSFIRKMSGGLSQGFAYPLLVAYLFFLARDAWWRMGFVILLCSLFNPYICLLCLGTHLCYLLWVFFTTQRDDEDGKPRRRAFLLAQWPVLIAISLIVLKYAVLTPGEFGELVTGSEMEGKPEYTATGRVLIVPPPALISELVRPWLDVFPVAEWGPLFGWIGAVLVTGTVGIALICPEKGIHLRGFKPFIYLLPASFSLYGISHTVLLKLFFPERYLEFSLNLLYCVVLGLSMSIIGRHLKLRRYALLLIPTLVFILAAVRLFGVGVYDYSEHEGLYRFLQNTPKDTVVAGHPELMDNILVFSKRRVFVSYELSHTWIRGYWNTIKERTTALFSAYYAENPVQIREFCSANGIKYVVVRERDFFEESLKGGTVYFEPFGSMIQELTRDRSRFAALDRESFPVIYERDGIRLLRIEDDSESAPHRELN